MFTLSLYETQCKQIASSLSDIFGLEYRFKGLIQICRILSCVIFLSTEQFPVYITHLLSLNNKKIRKYCLVFLKNRSNLPKFCGKCTRFQANLFSKLKLLRYWSKVFLINQSPLETSCNTFQHPRVRPRMHSTTQPRVLLIDISKQDQEGSEPARQILIL